jgi:hypothetical protein
MGVGFSTTASSQRTPAAFPTAGAGSCAARHSHPPSPVLLDQSVRLRRRFGHREAYASRSASTRGRPLDAYGVTITLKRFI